MRALKRIRAVPAPQEGSFEGLLAQFSAATRELNPSLGQRELTERLVSHVAKIFGARAVALALSRGAEWEIAALAGSAERWDQEIRERLAVCLGEQARRPTEAACDQAGSAILGAELARALGWHDLWMIRLEGSDQELLGILCLADLEDELSGNQVQLLDALAGYASVALENLRLFSRVERSRKQWVEDVDAISDFIVVHDQQCRVLRLNRALADALGVPPTGLVGSDIRSLGILATPRESGRCPFCRDLNSPSEEFIHPTGERTYLVSTSRIRATEGEAARTVHVLKDITDRREAERRYRRERDFNRNILNNTQSMILVVDTAGLISYLNRRCLEAGYRGEELLGRPLIDIVPPPRRPIFAEAVERALGGAPIDNLETPVSRGNGSTGQFSVSLSPMRDEQGDITSVVVVMTDITDAAELQAQLMHTEKMAALGQLVSGVAHEVNNPLAAIVGFTDLLLENPEIPADARQELRVILSEAQRTREIVQNLLRFARHMPAQREPVQINTLLEHVLKLRAYDCSNHGIEIIESYQQDLPLLAADPHQLQQVFLNILNNAYDAIRDVGRPGRIEVSTTARDGQIEIQLRDNGTGISHPERMFDPFFTTKEVGKGTGLGLSICYGIVRAHQGEIVGENHADGIGCTFTVRLPIATNSIELLAAEAALNGGA
jgi:two-component system, NtrC family, sensor kinase